MLEAPNRTLEEKDALDHSCGRHRTTRRGGEQRSYPSSAPPPLRPAAARPAPPRRLMGHVVRHAHLPSPVPPCKHRLYPSSLGPDFRFAGTALAPSPRAAATPFPAVCCSTPAPLRGARRGHRPVRRRGGWCRQAGASRACCWVTGLLQAAARPPRPASACHSFQNRQGPSQLVGPSVLAQPRQKKWESLCGVPGAAAFAGEAAVSSRKPEASGDPWRPG